MTYCQCDRLIARESYTYRHPTTGRKRNVKQGEVFWVTSSSLSNTNGIVSIAPLSESAGTPFKAETLETMFDKEKRS